jgi:hypothetical protein
LQIVKILLPGYGKEHLQVDGMGMHDQERGDSSQNLYGIEFQAP